VPRPATVTTLLRIVEEQSGTIRALTEALAFQMLRSTTNNDPFSPSVTNNRAFVSDSGDVEGYGDKETVIITLSEGISDAIDAVPGVDDEMRAYLEDMAAGLIADGMDERLVAQMIAQGEQ